jgi:hypothetical protein
LEHLDEGKAAVLNGSLRMRVISLMSPLKPRATKVGLSEKIRSMLANACSGIPLGLVFMGLALWRERTRLPGD